MSVFPYSLKLIFLSKDLPIKSNPPGLDELTKGEVYSYKEIPSI